MTNPDIYSYFIQKPKMLNNFLPILFTVPLIGTHYRSRGDMVRKRVILIAILLVAVAFAGCLGSGEDDKKESAPELVAKHGTIQRMSGWAESNWADSSNEPFIVDVDIGLTLNHSNVVQVQFTLKVEDSDPAHSESDQGSDPDDVTVTASGGNTTTDEKKGTTPATINIEVKTVATANEAVYLSQNWVVHLHADCYGGKPMYFFGFIVYKDQGVAWTLEGEYTYMAEEIA
jgi:hypothetical protein